LPRVPDDETLLVALDFYLDSFHQSLVEAAVGSVEVRLGTEAWTVGAGEVVATWAPPAFECFRALGGRRDEAQIRALGWTGDVAAIVPVVSRYAVPERGLVEP
jgi:hypothetical protein